MSTSGFSLFLALLHLTGFLFPLRVSAIRKDIGFLEERSCRTTVQGRYLISDDEGNVCDALSLESRTRCCPWKGERFSCHGCNLLSQCCKSYEFCVSCCLNPSRTILAQVVKVKVAKPATAGTYKTVFDFCSGRCRHNSESVVHENAYHSEFHHCFSLTSNASGANLTQVETRLLGIDVIVGSQGDSCDAVCKSRGQLCVMNKLSLLNQCDVMKRYMTCKGSCLASAGADQPAEVVEDAPRDLYPGACLYTRTESMLSCDGSHQHTRRLCPCA
ncbi:PREDICTED: uncharacterized protein LOC104699975 [Camelina sativa]|uniref:SREBP regulating gene protein n=1 Tax=Camelina sativa TaxID=90675 RepID=A0ABM0SN81_CAMSA|nr:PREDICTED: uncharacterized protein LOC104699975 [Camelina sativa]XP_019082943.1 PREDICTED: uncharacterized protein LOC104699975 [Camelina sativa]